MLSVGLLQQGNDEKPLIRPDTPNQRAIAILGPLRDMPLIVLNSLDDHTPSRRKDFSQAWPMDGELCRHIPGHPAAVLPGLWFHQEQSTSQSELVALLLQVEWGQFPPPPSRTNSKIAARSS
jgi:hypothetical protein